jgi:hypothetical protein
MNILLLTGRKFAVKCKQEEVKETKEGIDIVSIEFIKEKLIFKLNHYVNLNIDDGINERFLIKEIKHSPDPTYLYVVCSSILTKAYYILLPCLFGTFEDFNASGYLQNIYYNPETKELTLLYRENIEHCKASYEHLRKGRCYKSDTLLPSGYRLFVMSLPKNRDIEELCYLEGRYSELPDTYKQRICSFFNLYKDHELTMVLEKSDKLRKQMEHELQVKIPKHMELWSKVNPKEEVFNEEMIKTFSE